MHYNIDDFILFRSVAIVRGWTDSRDDIAISFGANRFLMKRISQVRLDLVPQYGSDASSWGFEAKVILDEGLQGGPLLWLGKNHIDLNALLSARVQASYSTPYHAFFSELRSATRPSVLELGSRARSGNTARDLFGEDYTGVDILPGPNVDIVADVHYLSDTVKTTFDFIFSISTFEHFIMPWQAVGEINKVMNCNGLILTQTHQTWPLHDEPWDFFRFSSESWRGLFNEATGFEIIFAGYAEPAICTPVTNFGNPATSMDYNICQLASICVARKIGESTVNYRIPRECYDRILGTSAYPF